MLTYPFFYYIFHCMAWRWGYGLGVSTQRCWLPKVDHVDTAGFTIIKNGKNRNDQFVLKERYLIVETGGKGIKNAALSPQGSLRLQTHNAHMTGHPSIHSLCMPAVSTPPPTSPHLGIFEGPFFPIVAPGPPTPPLPTPLQAPASGPRPINSPSPKSRHAGSLLACVARWMPNAACWSGTTSSSSSGLTGWWTAGT